MYYFRNNDYPDNGFRFFNDGEPIDAVGEYEVDIDYTYAPLYEPLEDTRDFGNRPTPPPPAANVPPIAGPPPYTPSPKDKNVQFMKEPNQQGGFLPGSPFGPPGQLQKAGSPSTKVVGPGSIRPCLFKFTYIWQTNGISYWAYITQVDRFSISGWRWRFGRWVYFGLDLRRIDSFVCY